MKKDCRKLLMLKPLRTRKQRANCVVYNVHAGGNLTEIKRDLYRNFLIAIQPFSFANFIMGYIMEGISALTDKQ